MPLYDYKCDKCGHEHDHIMKHTDPAPKCPKCGAAEYKKQISAGTFQLKGSGWYVTDFKNKK